MTPTDTTQLILETEAKVALQWAKASGNTLAHSGGFSFRGSRTEPCKPLSPVASSTMRVVRPTRKEPSARGSTLALALLLLLFLGLGIGYAAHGVQPSEPRTTTPLMW